MAKCVRIWALFLALVLCISVPAAASSASALESHSIVHPDGSIQVMLTVQLELQDGQLEYSFPIPQSATEVLLEGAPAQTVHRGDAQWVLLQTGTGSYTATISYRLPDAVVLEKDTATVQLELLSGFPYPITGLSFTVTLPDVPTAEPVLVSGYYQESIGQLIALTRQDHVLQGSMTGTLKDHETLHLTVLLDRAAFDSMERFQIHLSVWDGILAGLLLLAIGYYLLTLLPRLTRRTECYGAPDGVTAGELGTCLTACGTDMALLVLSWAQMGYLTVEIDRADHVVLHKHMEMGNERSKLEMRCFQDLFDRRTQVDGTGQHYAKIAHIMAGKSNLLQQLYDPRSGNPWIFRGLLLLPGILFGVRMGIALGGGPGVRALLASALAVICAVLGWLIQSGGKCLPLRNKMPLVLSLLCCGLWMVPGIISGYTALAALLAAMQFAGGIAAAYGGKRSELGIRTLAQIRGLRHYLRTVRPAELQQRMSRNPDYFYELAPYALALGMDRRFAHRFGRMRLPESGYLDVGTQQAMTARQWASELRYAVDILNKTAKRFRP